MVDQILVEYMSIQLAQVRQDFHRYLYDRLNWEARMVAILGARGVGKSTMVLQYIREHQEIKSLYVSADHTYFTLHTLTDVADSFSRDGGQLLVIDEIHKYPGWSKELKQIYDTHPDMRVIFTGSSVLDITEGISDLSRRVLNYVLYGLSYREYLELFHGIRARAFSLEEILSGKVEVQGLMHPLQYFENYLYSGYYPFSIEGDFEQRMQNVIIKTVESDIAQYADLKAVTARKLRKLLAVVSKVAPFKPNADNLSSEIGVSRNSIADYLILLEKAQMIGQLRDDTGGMRGLGKVEKIYVDNPSLTAVLSAGEPNVGNLRETFFFNQMRVNNDVLSSRSSDFNIGGRIFEIGGRKKGKKQIEGIENGYIVKDDVEYAWGNVIPLWMFGMNY